MAEETGQPAVEAAPEGSPNLGEETPIDTALGAPSDKDIAAPVDWPADWQNKFAGEDEKDLKALSRFKSPVDIFKSWKQATQKISAGKLRAPFPAEGSDDEKAAWRKDNGVPDKADAYLADLPDGLVIGDDDKPGISLFAERMHARGADKGTVQEAIATYYEIQDQAIADRAVKDKQAKIATEEELRAELGAEYRPTMGAVANFLESAPEGVKDLWLNARLGDGTPLASHAPSLRALATWANEINPAGPVVPGSGTNSMQGLTDEIASIEGLMADRSSEYWVGPKAKAHKERYRVLVDARDKMNKRAKGA